MNWRIGIVPAIILLSLSACVQPQSMRPPVEQGWKPDTTNADHGQYPKNYVAIIKKWYMANLKDPESAKFISFSKPRKEHAIANQFTHEAIYGYTACATVNAKNSYGGYSGNKTDWFLIRNGAVVRQQNPQLHIYIGHYPNCSDG